MHKCLVKPGPEQEWYSIEAAAAYLTIGRTTIYKAIQQRKIRHFRPGKGKIIRIKHEHLIQWVEEGTKSTLEEIEKIKNGNSKRHNQRIKNRLINDN